MIYENVAKEFKKRGISLAELSRGTGISQPKISMTFSGKRRMTPEELFKYCRFFGLDPNYFSEDRGLDAQKEEEQCKDENEAAGQGEETCLAE